MDLQQAQDLFNQARKAYENKDSKKAVSLLKQIDKSSDDTKDIYAKAQCSLGIILKLLNCIKDAEVFYKNVSREDSAEQYAKAQLNLGILLREQQRFEEAEQAYKNVCRDDSGKQYYSMAQFNLGILLNDLKRFDEAEEAYKNVTKEDGVEIFEKAQKALSNLQYEMSVRVENSNPNKQILEEITALVASIEKLLLIDFNETNEQYFAHYTQVEIAKKLTNIFPDEEMKKKTKELEEVKKFNEASSLRLNPIDFMNDPTEGQLLLEALNLNEIENLDVFKLVDHSELKPFIACFTLHHDSLNQFRLYGKTNSIEASGVSLVLDRSFFMTQEIKSLSDSLINIDDVIDEYTATYLKNNLKIENSNNYPTQKIKSSSGFGLYRCIYWDPESSLVEVANVERWAFWRLKKGNNDEEWKKYADNIMRKEKKISKYLADLEKKLKVLFSSNHEDKNKLIVQVLSIILRLRYLVKHFAYREEQECRLLHLTKLDNENIVFTPEHKLYLDYRSVLPSLEKIYLAAGALEHKTTFEYLLAQAKKNGKMPIKKDEKGADQLVKVSKSHNPFRAL